MSQHSVVRLATLRHRRRAAAELGRQLLSLIAELLPMDDADTHLVDALEHDSL